MGKWGGAETGKKKRGNTINLDKSGAKKQQVNKNKTLNTQ